MPPAYVKTYVKRGKTDAADAEAIAEAVTRPTMRFVAVKSKAQQATLMLHKTRDLMVRQRTMLINAVRGHLGEYGITAAKGAAGVRTVLKAVYLQQEQLPELARAAMHGLARQLEALEREIERLEARIVAWHREDETSRRLATIPGIGPITASAIAASAPDPRLFRSARQLDTSKNRVFLPGMGGASDCATAELRPLVRGVVSTRQPARFAASLFKLVRPAR